MLSVAVLLFLGFGGHAEGQPTVGVAQSCLIERVECSRRLRSASAWTAAFFAPV